MRVATRRALLSVVMVTSACVGYRRVDTAPAPGSQVRIVLATALDVTAITSTGTRETHAEILEVSGTIEAASADTVAVRLGELRTATGAIANLAGQTALLPVAHIARIEQRELQAGRTALAGIGLATLAVAGFLIVIIVALTKGF